MKTLEMMNEAEETGKTYIVDDMRYSTKLGFHDSDGSPWYADIFEYINDIMDIDEWKTLSWI